LLIEGVSEALVAGVAGQHDTFRPGSAGDGGRTGVVLPGTGVGVTVGVVPELGEHPGREDLPESRLGQVDLSVRMLPKILFHLPG
jgi:hypothetical protein